MTLKLFQLTQQYNTLLALAGEDPEAFEQAIADLQDDLTDKVIATAKVIRSLEAQAKTYEDEMDRLAGHLKTQRNAAARLKEYLHDNLVSAGVAHVQGDVVDVRLQDSPPSVEVYDDAALGAEWKKATLRMPLAQVPEELLGMATVEVDRRGILDWVKGGGTAPDGTAITRGSHVRIR